MTELRQEKTKQDELRWFLSDLCQEYRSAGWTEGWEFQSWRALWSMDPTLTFTEEDRDRLGRIANDAGGWARFPEDDEAGYEVLFVPWDEWVDRLEKNLADAELTFGGRNMVRTAGSCKTDNGDVEVRDRRKPGEFMSPERYQALYVYGNDNGFWAETEQGALDLLLAHLKLQRRRLDRAFGDQHR